MSTPVNAPADKAGPQRVSTPQHPLRPLTATEITVTAELVRSVWPQPIDLRFKVITLAEPPKKDMIPYFVAELAGSVLPMLPRKSFVSYYIRNTVSHRPHDDP